MKPFIAADDGQRAGVGQCVDVEQRRQHAERTLETALAPGEGLT
jgi:hypothetical protein